MPFGILRKLFLIRYFHKRKLETLPMTSKTCATAEGNNKQVDAVHR